MDFIEKMGCGLIILWIFVLIFGGIGWVMNVVKLVKLDFQAPYKAEIIRTVGLFPVVGAITGWIDIND